MFNRLLILSLVLLASCKAALPVIVTSQVSGEDAPIAIGRTNLRQTFIAGTADFVGEIMTNDGIPIFVHHVSAGVQLYIDRDADIRFEAPIGTPLPASAKILFPRTGEAAALGITFEE